MYALLVLTLYRNGLDYRAWVVLRAAILCTVLVVARQLLAFTDDTRLVTALNDEVRQRTALAAELQHQAHHDQLTGLANRRVCHTDR